MGFFSKLKSNVNELNKLSNSVSNVKLLLDKSENEIDSDEADGYLFFAAWICCAGIIDRCSKNTWSMTKKIGISINGHATYITIYEAYALTVNRLTNKVESMNENIQDIVSDILNKGEWYYKVGNSLPEEKKRFFI
jgi:hypothetical protein